MAHSGTRTSVHPSIHPSPKQILPGGSIFPHLVLC
uniref:Uncharacterized protein n=1 Tax=Anguilla anguilla TaxID=7936 RepID=A0A0E9RGA4_ANGAN